MEAARVERGRRGVRRRVPGETVSVHTLPRPVHSPSGRSPLKRCMAITTLPATLNFPLPDCEVVLSVLSISRA
jgi:hypothetical protein